MVEIKKVSFSNVWMLSDIHFGVRSNSLEWLDNILNYFYNFLIPTLKENKKDNDIFCVLGDLFDNRQSIDINIQNKAIDVIHEISTIMPVHLIVGNHDIYRKNDTDVNSLRCFKYIQNVHVYEEPTIISNDKINILLLPWLGDNTDDSMLKSPFIDYIFAHSDIQGFKYDNGKDITKGLNLEGITVKKVYSGHIHKRQELKNWVYLGSPYHTKRSDISNIKGIYCLNTINDTHTFYQNTYSPIFQKISLNNLLNMNLSQIKYALNNNYTDILISQEHVNLFNLSKFTDLLKNCNYKHISTFIDKKTNNLEMSIDDNSDTKSIEELIYETICLNAQEESDIDILVKLNNKYYELAKKDL